MGELAGPHWMPSSPTRPVFITPRSCFQISRPVIVVAVQALGSEQRHHVRAVGGGRGRGVAGFEVALDAWHALEGRLLPHHLPRRLLERHHLPRLPAIVGGHADAGMPDVELRVGRRADGGRHEHAVAPDDGTGMAKTGNSGLPHDMAVRREIPRRRHGASPRRRGAPRRGTAATAARTERRHQHATTRRSRRTPSRLLTAHCAWRRRAPSASA